MPVEAAALGDQAEQAELQRIALRRPPCGSAAGRSCSRRWRGRRPPCRSIRSALPFSVDPGELDPAPTARPRAGGGPPRDWPRPRSAMKSIASPSSGCQSARISGWASCASSRASARGAQLRRIAIVLLHPGFEHLVDRAAAPGGGRIGVDRVERRQAEHLARVESVRIGLEPVDLGDRDRARPARRGSGDGAGRPAGRCAAGPVERLRPFAQLRRAGERRRSSPPACSQKREAMAGARASRRARVTSTSRRAERAARNHGRQGRSGARATAGRARRAAAAPARDRAPARPARRLR